jgi:hypothetical protein
MDLQGMEAMLQNPPRATVEALQRTAVLLQVHCSACASEDCATSDAFRLASLCGLRYGLGISFCN